MSSSSSVAAALCPETRQQIAIEALAKSKPISHLATDYEVSRKFVYEQSNKAKQALDDSFEPTTPDEQVLFHLPMVWLKNSRFQVTLAAQIRPSLSMAQPSLLRQCLSSVEALKTKEF